jgi:hypothetical protein
MSCLSWKWGKRSSVKIAERTYEEVTKASHSRRESGHLEATPFGQDAVVGLVRTGSAADGVLPLAIQTAELGYKQRIRGAVNERIGIEPPD